MIYTNISITLIYLLQDDLLALRVVNVLHHLSIKRGIQVLRVNNFTPTCLKRRPAPDEVRGPSYSIPFNAKHAIPVVVLNGFYWQCCWE